MSASFSKALKRFDTRGCSAHRQKGPAGQSASLHTLLFSHQALKYSFSFFPNIRRDFDFFQNFICFLEIAKLINAFNFSVVYSLIVADVRNSITMKEKDAFIRPISNAVVECILC